VVVLGYILPAVYEGSFFLTFSPTFVVGGVFDDSHSNRGEVNLSVFLFAFPYGQG
jgi:hypothetical protein